MRVDCCSLRKLNWKFTGYKLAKCTYSLALCFPARHSSLPFPLITHSALNSGKFFYSSNPLLLLFRLAFCPSPCPCISPPPLSPTSMLDARKTRRCSFLPSLSLCPLLCCAISRSKFFLITSNYSPSFHVHFFTFHYFTQLLHFPLSLLTHLTNSGRRSNGHREWDPLLRSALSPLHWHSFQWYIT